MNQITEFTCTQFDEEIADQVVIALAQHFGEGFSVEKRTDDPKTLLTNFNGIWFKIKHEVGVEWNVFTKKTNWQFDLRNPKNPIVRNFLFQQASHPISRWRSARGLLREEVLLTKIGGIRQDKTIFIKTDVGLFNQDQDQSIAFIVQNDINKKRASDDEEAFFKQQIALFQKTNPSLKLRKVTKSFFEDGTVIAQDGNIDLFIHDHFTVEAKFEGDHLKILQTLANIGFDDDFKLVEWGHGFLELYGSAEKIGKAITLINNLANPKWFKESKH